MSRRSRSAPSGSRRRSRTSREPEEPRAVQQLRFRALRALRVTRLRDMADLAFEELQPLLKSREDFAAPLTEPRRPLHFESQLRVAFCMTLKNRHWQLKHSLPINLMNLWPHRSWTRIFC